jgi:hypothetical protein
MGGIRTYIHLSFCVSLLAQTSTPRSNRREPCYQMVPVFSGIMLSDGFVAVPPHVLISHVFCRV